MRRRSQVDCGFARKPLRPCGSAKIIRKAYPNPAIRPTGVAAETTGMQNSSINKQANVFCRLAPLDEAEVCSYVLHRLRIAGCTRQLFTSDALSAIALYSRGIPLNINMLCRHAMLLAATINLQFVDEKIVADSAYDLILRTQPSSGFAPQYWTAPTILDTYQSYSASKPPEKGKVCKVPIFLIQTAVKSPPNIHEIGQTS
jgi:hypothetical protein